MSEHNPVEITGNIIVHHPIKKQAEVIQYADWFNKEWDALRAAQTTYNDTSFRTWYIAKERTAA